MILLLAAFGMAPTNPSALFDVSVSNFRKLGNYTVHVDVKGKAAGKVQNTQMDLAVSGRDALLRVREPATATVDRSDRSFQILGNKLLAFDAVASEKIVKSIAGSSSLSNKFTSVLGQLDDSLKVVLDPAAMRSFFDKFSGFKDWHVFHKNGLVSIARSTRDTTTIFWFAEGTYLLKEAAWNIKNSTLDWKFDFKRGASTELRIPNNARRVASFYVKEAPPVYKSAAAKAVVEKLLSAYSKLQYGRIDIVADDGNSRIFLDGKRLREERQRFTWAFDGKNLTMKNLRTGAFYSGKAIRVVLSEYITKVGGEVDPIIRRLIAHRTPYQDLFPSHATVSLVGTFGTGNNVSDIIEVNSNTLKVSVFVRRADHLIESMESVTIDRLGHNQSLGNRRFKYIDIGSEPKNVEYHLGAGGTKVLPLPKVSGA